MCGTFACVSLPARGGLKDVFTCNYASLDIDFIQKYTYSVNFTRSFNTEVPICSDAFKIHSCI